MRDLLHLLRSGATDQPPPLTDPMRRVALLGLVLSGLVVVWTSLPPDPMTHLVSSFGVILGGLGLLTELTMGLIRRRPQRWRVIRRMTGLSVVLMLVRVLGPFMVASFEADSAATLAFGLALLILQVFVFSGPALPNTP